MLGAVPHQALDNRAERGMSCLGSKHEHSPRGLVRCSHQLPEYRVPIGVAAAPRVIVVPAAGAGVSHEKSSVNVRSRDRRGRERRLTDVIATARRLAGCWQLGSTWGDVHLRSSVNARSVSLDKRRRSPPPSRPRRARSVADRLELCALQHANGGIGSGVAHPALFRDELQDQARDRVVQFTGGCWSSALIVQ
jgi:hypothetical protein